jgi:hypothetical protein
MAWGRNVQDRAPAGVVEAGVPDGDKLLAAARDELGDQWVLATTTRVAVVGVDAALRVSRPWLDVDRGAWDPDSDLLRVTWVNGGGPTRWQFTGRAARTFTDAFRERVQASVVLVREVDLGPGRRTRVAVRKDLASRALTDQVIPGTGVQDGDTELAEQVAVARATLRDQTGMPPLTAW